MGRLAVLVVLITAACDVGSVLPEGGAGAPDANGGGGGGGGGGNVDAAVVAAAPLTVNFTSSPAGGPYNPSHVVAVWIEGAGGVFVKTIGRWSATRTGSLVAWNAKSGGDADAVSGATRNAHTPATVTWDLKDKQDAVVADGTYTIRMEVADANATTPAENNQGTFTFVKGTAPQSQTALTNGGFLDVAIEFTP